LAQGPKLVSARGGYAAEVDAMADAGGEMSKSAKKRANQKAKKEAEEAAAAAAAAPPAPEPKSKAKAKAKPEAKAAAAPKAEPKAEPKAKAKAEGKAKAEPKGKAKAEPKAAPEPPAPAAEPKAASKSKAKSGAKAQAKPKAAPKEEEEPVKKVEELINFVIDDGTGGEWEVSTGLDKKAQKRKQKMEEEKAELARMQAAAGGKPLPKNMVPGMAPLDPRAAAANKAAANQAASADVARILAKKNEEEVQAAANLQCATITVPEKKIGIVIGPAGSTIKTIQEKTKVTRIDTAGGIFTITGNGSAVAEAEAAIKELITKGFCSLLYEDFSENFIAVHPSYFPDLIGKGGVIIQKIKKELKVEVGIPQGTEGAKPDKKFKVTLAGSAKQVEQAKEVINNIMMYGHDEITHPGVTHEELEVESWKYSFLIGKGGSELKHIQKNWDVKVNIPRPQSANQNVLIVGDPANVARAKTYVEKVLWNAENNVRSGRDKADGADDGWGDEDEDEPWMKEYLYKRN